MNPDDFLTLIDWLPTDQEDGKTLTDIACKLDPAVIGGGDNLEIQAYRKRLARWCDSLVDQEYLNSTADKGGLRNGKRSKTRRYWLNEQNKLVRRLVFAQDSLAVAALTADLLRPLSDLHKGAPAKGQKALRQMDSRIERQAIFRDRIRVVPDGIPRSRYDFDNQLVATAVDAMALNRCIELTYTAQDSAFSYGPQSGRYVLTVLGLALKETTVYLIGRAHDRDRPRYFNLARCKDGRLSDSPAGLTGRFDIDQFIEEEDNLTRAESAKPMRLELHVHKNAIFHFRERELKDQEIIDQADGSFLVHATVRDSIQLEPFLWSHAPWVHVVSPPEYRRRVQLHIMQALKRYLDSELAEPLAKG